MRQTITSEGGRVINVDVLTKSEVEQKVPSVIVEDEWMPNDIYDTQLSNMNLSIDTSVDRLYMKAERVIERRLLLWVSWACVFCVVLLLWV